MKEFKEVWHEKLKQRKTLLEASNDDKLFGDPRRKDANRDNNPANQSMPSKFLTAAAKYMGNLSKGLSKAFKGIGDNLLEGIDEILMAGKDFVRDPEYQKALKDFILAMKEFMADNGQTEANMTKVKNTGAKFHEVFAKVIENDFKFEEAEDAKNNKDNPPNNPPNTNEETAKAANPADQKAAANISNPGVSNPAEQQLQSSGGIK